MSGTIQDFNMIRERVDQLSSDSSYLPYKAFLVLLLKKWVELGDLSDDDVEASIIDGGGDFGIDAIYIDTADNQNPHIYLFQSKYRIAVDKMNRPFPSNDMIKLWTSFENLLLNPSFDPVGANELLVDKLTYIRNLSVIPRYSLVFCSNCEHPTAEAKAHLDELKKRKFQGRDVEFKYLGLEEISKMLVPPRRRQIDTQIRLSKGYFTYEAGTVRTLIGMIDGFSIWELLDAQVEDDEIFDMNIRGFLQVNRKNSINRKIYQSATTDDSNFFFFLNNGITMICKNFKYGFQDSPLVHLTDLQIVNGGQTARAIARAKRDGELKNLFVLVRIVETSSSDLVEKIIEATNNQNVITSRDLRSNDEIQKKIEQRLQSRGLYYEARKDKYRFDPKISSEKRIDALSAAQTYFAYYLGRPADAKTNKRKLFEEYYPDVFNDEIDIDAFLFSYLLFKRIFKENKNWKNTEGYGFVDDAALTILAALRLSSLKQESIINEALFVVEYKKIVGALKEMVEEEKGRNEKYSNRAFFLKKDTFDRLLKNL